MGLWFVASCFRLVSPSRRLTILRTKLFSFWLEVIVVPPEDILSYQHFFVFLFCLRGVFVNSLYERNWLLSFDFVNNSAFFVRLCSMTQCIFAVFDVTGLDSDCWFGTDFIWYNFKGSGFDGWITGYWRSSYFCCFLPLLVARVKKELVFCPLAIGRRPLDWIQGQVRLESSVFILGSTPHMWWSLLT